MPCAVVCGRWRWGPRHTLATRSRSAGDVSERCRCSETPPYPLNEKCWLLKLKTDHGTSNCFVVGSLKTVVGGTTSAKADLVN